jgi:LAO/AO transport system kinase
LEANGFFAKRRKHQALDWMRELLSMGLQDLLRCDPATARLLPSLETAVQDGAVAPSVAARQLLAVFRPKEQ